MAQRQGRSKRRTDRPAQLVTQRLEGIHSRNWRGRVVERWAGSHPLFPGQRLVLRARRVLAERLGRPLRPGEVAHHKNADTLDDRRGNIVLREVGQHVREHAAGKKKEGRPRPRRVGRLVQAGVVLLSPEDRDLLRRAARERGTFLGPFLGDLVVAGARLLNVQLRGRGGTAA